ncbi:MAG: hypothetical protein ABII12_04210 [Planctomycetota bacterium]
MNCNLATLCGFGLMIFGLGCSASDRPCPVAAFDELSKRALNSDVEYVRARLSPAFVKQAGGDEAALASDEFVRSMMSQLQVCRALSSEAVADDPDKVVLRVAGIQSGRVWEHRFDMTYDRKIGWQLASDGHDSRPMHQQPEKK